tara:strand:+ start:18814 stop:18960 length:147 start_codon:yes stop_codon:yes gene_type:complete
LPAGKSSGGHAWVEAQLFSRIFEAIVAMLTETNRSLSGNAEQARPAMA